MERRSGFKECPKCGLRNKPSATQCDFCGQNLGASDDWQQHIKDLESLNKMELRKPLDDRTSKRIASTIIRKDTPAVRNVEIKEAGNIGMVLRELDERPSKEKDLEPKGDRLRHTPAQEKLRIKEAIAPAKVEQGPGDAEGTTIADLLKVIENTTPSGPAAEPPGVRSEPEPETLGVVEGERRTVEEQEEVKEAVIETRPSMVPEIPPEQPEEPSPPREQASPTEEEVREEASPPAALQMHEGAVPANEVTLEVVQAPQTEAMSIGNEGARDEGQEIVVSSNASREVIKLRLVEVEKKEEGPAPAAIHHHHIPARSIAIAALVLGSVAYLIVLSLTALGLLGTAGGLGGGAISSFLVVYGAAVIYPSLRKKVGDEVYICPKCHEKVEKSSEGCPACGSEFDSED